MTGQKIYMQFSGNMVQSPPKKNHFGSYDFYPEVQLLLFYNDRAIFWDLPV